MSKRSPFLAIFVLMTCASDSSPGVFLFSDSQFFDPYIVTHPAGYDGTGGLIELKICSDRRIEAEVEIALSYWNELARSTENCEGCRLAEQNPSINDGPRDLQSMLIHELGHCALALDHINWVDVDGEGTTSYTATVGAASISNGPDGFRGTLDDIVSPLPGARLIHWFRDDSNDPIATDDFVVDSSTYSRRIIDLPAGHSWPANGNLLVALVLLGYEGPGTPRTQSVMYSIIDRQASYRGLAADDVNTVSFAMSGLDESAGTSDDYQVLLTLAEDCEEADIEIRFDQESFDPESASLAFCAADLESLAPPGELDIHHRVAPLAPYERPVILINDHLDWGFVFDDGFESGQTNRWSGSFP